MDLWDIIISCNTCENQDYIESMHMVPDAGKIVCKSCSLREETRVIPVADINTEEGGWEE